MKRFLLFAGSSYYPDGGWNDFQGSFNTKEEMKIEEKFYPILEREKFPDTKAGEKAYTKQLKPVVRGYKINESEYDYDWYHIVDTNEIE